MGDRANVLMKSGNREGVYLYTHWEGYRLPEIVQTALKKEKRWDDEPYLTRIIFCEMVKDTNDIETGYGISGYLCDGGDQVITIDVDKQTVNVFDKTYSFKEYVELDLKNKHYIMAGYPPNAVIVD